MSDRLGNIERDDRRWTIEWFDPTWGGHDGDSTIDGPPVNEAVEVVPASQLRGAVGALERIAHGLQGRGDLARQMARDALAELGVEPYANRGQ